MHMIEIVQSVEFGKWLKGLKDRQARTRIIVRIERIALGNFGDHKPVGEGVSEMRFTFGPGYRVYFTMRGAELVILLAGGDKGSQTKDIEAAKAIARRWE